MKYLPLPDAPWQRWLVWSARLSALAVAVIFATLAATRDVAPRVTVEWDADTAERDHLERRFQLTERQPRPDGSYEYDLVDTSSSNIRSLVSDRQVRVVGGIDTNAFRPVPNGPIGTRRIWLADRLPILKEPFVVPWILVTLVAIIFLGLGLQLASHVRPVAFLHSRIQPINAGELGFFRVVFATLLWLTFSSLRLPPDPFPREFHIGRSGLANWEWVHWLASQPLAVARLEELIFGTIVLFGLGLATRVVYPLLVAQLTVWTLVVLQHTGVHPWGVALVTAWGLLTVRWDERFSLSESIRRLRGRSTSRQPRGRGFGFALWLPGLVLGMAMAAAGAAKLRESGLEWILGGAVKYHFVIDAANAPTDWGLWIASHHEAAILFSFLAVATELSLAVAPIVRTYRGRLPVALAGLGLLCGFWAFQNEFWSGWWMLWVLFFLPWPRVFRWLRRTIPHHVVILDESCPRCQRTGRVLRAFDWFDRIRTATVDEALDDPDLAGGADREELLQSMHVVCRDGTHMAGYRGYLHVAASLPPLWPLLPIAALPGVTTLGEKVYERLAASRPRRATAACPVPVRRTACVRLRPAQITVVVLIGMLQASASLLRLELEPLMTDYPMYSSTYGSTAEFDRINDMSPDYAYVGHWNGRREDLSEALEELELEWVIRDTLLAANRHGVTSDTIETLNTVATLFESATGIRLERVELLADRRAFDWTRGQIYWQARGELVAAFDLDTQK